MIKMIKPVVNISKVIEPFDTVIVGLYGVLYDGRSFKTEAVEALKAMKRSGRKIVLVSNASLRVQQVIRLLNDNKVPVMVLTPSLPPAKFCTTNSKSRMKHLRGWD